MQVELPHHIRLILQEIELATKNAEIHTYSFWEIHKWYKSVDIDVSKDKSMVAILQHGGTIICKLSSKTNPKNCPTP
ncbi:hypothetical protein QMP26_19595 [Enterocloster clostridioformis]